jgi:hypothetical protein
LERASEASSINNGNTWKTKADGYEATIQAITYCPKANCFARPYIKTNPDSTKKDNLEKLDRC